MKTPDTILVTGGCGYIGSQLIRRLPDQNSGVVIRILDNLSTGNYRALMNLPTEGHYQFVEADILDPTQLDFALKDVDVVIHLAAIVKTPLSFDNPNWIKQVNYWGTAHLVNACIEHNVDHFIYVSTTSVYGPGGPFNESSMPKPLGAYAMSKRSAEEYIHERAGGFDYTILRAGTVYGKSPVLRVESFVNRLAMLAGIKKKLTVFGDGKQQRPVIYLDDLCGFISTILNNRKDFKKQTFNVIENNYQVNEIVDQIKEIKPDCEFHHTEQDLRTRYSFVADSSKLKDHGWTPRYPLKKGLQELLKNFRSFERIRLNIP